MPLYTTVSILRKDKHYLTVPFSVHSSTKDDSSVMYVLADAELIPDSSLILDPSSNVEEPNQVEEKRIEPKIPCKCSEKPKFTKMELKL